MQHVSRFRRSSDREGFLTHECCLDRRDPCRCSGCDHRAGGRERSAGVRRGRTCHGDPRRGQRSRRHGHQRDEPGRLPDTPALRAPGTPARARAAAVAPAPRPPAAGPRCRTRAVPTRAPRSSSMSVPRSPRAEQEPGRPAAQAAGDHRDGRGGRSGHGAGQPAARGAGNGVLREHPEQLLDRVPDRERLGHRGGPDDPARVDSDRHDLELR